MEDEIERELDETVRADQRNDTIGQALITDVTQHDDGERVTLQFKLPDGDEHFKQTFSRPRYATKNSEPSLSVLYDESYQSLSDVRHDLFDVHLDANGEWELDAVVEATSGSRLERRAETATDDTTPLEERLTNIGGLLGVLTAAQALVGTGLLLLVLLVSLPLTLLFADPILTIATASLVISIGVTGVVGVFELNRRLQGMLFDRAADTPFLPTVHTLESLSVGDTVRFTGLAGTYRITDVNIEQRQATVVDTNDGSLSFDARLAEGLLTTGARKWVAQNEASTDLGYCTPKTTTLTEQLSGTLGDVLDDA